MEYVSGIKLRDIFLDNGNWWKLFLRYRHLIRPAIIINVLKMLSCRTTLLGFHLYSCFTCGFKRKVPHTCKSRLCSPCGKKATDNWIKTKFNSLPHTKWQHITFTMPDKLWDFFWMNRHLISKLPALAAKIVKDMAREQGFVPGIFAAIHTFGRDLKRNVHIHLSTTIGGLSPDWSNWIAKAYFHHLPLKKRWAYEVLTLLQDEYKAGRLRLPPQLKRKLTSYTIFRSWISQFFKKTWAVHLGLHTDNPKKTIEYLGKYIKRPPIGETRILNYNGVSVTFFYLDHYTKTRKILTLPVSEFLERVISHVPDMYFRTIRYFGFLSNRLSGKCLPIVFRLLKTLNFSRVKVSVSWRNMIKNLFRIDPLKCPGCGDIMRLANIVLPNRNKLLGLHKEIAHGFFPLL